MAIFVTLTSDGVPARGTTVQASSGAPDADRLISLNASGKVDTTMIPSLNIPQLRMSVVTGVALTQAINAVYLTYNATDSRIELQLARANNIDTLATGVVVGTHSSGDSVLFHYGGLVDISDVTLSLTQNGLYYLDYDNAGQLVTARTTTTGEFNQTVGYLRGDYFQLALGRDPIGNA